MVLTCISLMTDDVLFHVPIGHLYVFSGEMSIQGLCSFLNGVGCVVLLNCRNSLHTHIQL